ncbi:MAG: N-succinylarginine dihydrolase [Sandaracinus sp.]|nr:N-succinylarginine dihydrolase [Sandaracinus sp.]
MNFDGLVGPTHNYAGLSHGNVASRTHGGQPSRPREAALQGLSKMAHVRDLGLPQGILPPHARPRLDVLRALGFLGDDAEVLRAVADAAPHLLAAVSSASPMWTANAATVSASADTLDGRVHFTPANLASTFHRSLEPEHTGRALRRIFPGEVFVHHDPLPGMGAFGDEGAANHTRFVARRGGLELHVFGRSAFGGGPAPTRYPARQTREASEALVRRHGVRSAVLIQQATAAIDAGVFHNDVISVGSGDHFLVHERAFEAEDALARVRQAFDALGGELQVFVVRDRDLSVAEAVTTYLFNSQLLSTPGGWVLVAPMECAEDPRARAVTEAMVAEGFVARVETLDLRQSMHNGGGPACLRLRVPLTDAERAEVHEGCVFTPEREAALRAWVTEHYREELRPADLADPALTDEVRTALDELTQLLSLGSDFYPFQR